MKRRWFTLFLLTLGQITEELKTFLSQELFIKVKEGIEKRNFLAHHFWFERAHLMFSVAGLKSMIKELTELSSFFSAIDEEVSKFFKAKKNELGFTDDLVEFALLECVAGKPMEPLPCKRKLKKQEKIVRAWEFALSNGNLPLVFETDDGCLWEFCDVGLGWTNYEKTEKEWKLNEKIQPNLPATVNPRPENSTPWNYEFMLLNNTILWVKPGSLPRSFKWGLKKKTER